MELKNFPAILFLSSVMTFWTSLSESQETCKVRRYG